MNQRFKMQNYCIDVDYGTHVLNRLRTRFDMESAWLDYILELIFTDENVADYLINDVRIGEDVIVIDEDSGVSFALNVGTDCFYVKTVFNAYDDSVPFLIMALAGGMGVGDAKLMAAVGILLGWKQTLLAAFFGIVIGCIAALILKIRKKRGWKSEIPFGPFLCIGSFLSMLVGEQMWFFELHAFFLRKNKQSSVIVDE